MNRLYFFLATLSLFAAGLPARAQTSADQARLLIRNFQDLQSHVRPVEQVSLSSDGLRAAWTVDDPAPKKHQVYIAPLKSPSTARALEIPSPQPCNIESAEWAPDAHRLAVLSDCATPGQLQVFVADTAQSSPPRQLTHLKGYVSHLGWSPDGNSIALLYVESASRAPSPLAAENKAVGVIDDIVNRDVQRLNVIELRTGAMRTVTPPGMYIFEYGWSPDSKSFAYTAAAPPGDDNWYIAQLYTQPIADAKPVSIFQPKLQIALPQWSPDGKSIAFIQGLMSDEGATGGEIYQIPSQGGEPHNLTPSWPSSPAWFTWLSSGEILFTDYVGGSTAVNTLDTASGKTRHLWQAGDTIQASEAAASLAVARQGSAWTFALTRTSWSRLPEVWAGPIDDLTQITQLNAAVPLSLPKSESLSWKSGEFPVQGWLLYPAHYDPSKKYPLLVAVHGGPAWIAQPTWKSSDFNTTVFTQLGYFVLFPNDRGSYGQGEKFTQANRREWGFGDLDDLVAGVDAVVKQFPVDSDRVGILGWSYGGSTAMMAVTRTHRFRAAVAGAGAVNMQSYYGENSIDKWMIPYFGATVYDDPAAYMRCSAITYIKNARTPTLILVGELDGEAPPEQSLEFWHALKELGVPTQLVIYPDEGHSFFKPEDRIDLTVRTFAWFEKYMVAK